MDPRIKDKIRETSDELQRLRTTLEMLKDDMKEIKNTNRDIQQKVTRKYTKKKKEGNE